jgi:thioredoxin reductase (NADPH)
MIKGTIPDNIYDIVIIGGGPAGLTAGLYIARARIKALLVESPAVMSQAIMTDLIENYPGVKSASGAELVSTMKGQAVKFGLKCESGTVKKVFSGEEGGLAVWNVQCEKTVYKTLTVIVASGASPKKLEVPGEAEFLGRGVSYCATCDGPFFRDKEIVVVGGGNAAVEEAIFLTRFAKKVTIIHRKEKLRADKVVQERAFASEKIGFLWETVVEAIKGGEKVEKVAIKNVKTGLSGELPCEGVFIFAGWHPNTDFLEDALKLGGKKEKITVDSSMNTDRKGIFACGDCCSRPLHQVITACGDGAVAANSAQKYVEELKGIVYK